MVTLWLNLALSGSMTVKETAAGTFTYGIACSGVPPSATAKATVSFSASSGSSSSGGGTSGGGGGGGALQPDFLALLALLVPLSRMRRPKPLE